MSNSKEQLFSDDYVRGFLAEQLDNDWFKVWDDYVRSNPPIPEPIVEMPRSKHPIELVNEKYPNGWYCEEFQEVKDDIRSRVGEDAYCFTDGIKYWAKDNSPSNSIYAADNSKFSDGETFITRSEYMAITRPNEMQEWKPKEGELVEIYGDNESDGVFRGEYSYTTKDGYHYIKGKDVIGCINIRPASKSIHIEQPKPEPTQRIESLEKSRKELFTFQSNIFSRLDALELQNEKYQKMSYKWDETLEGVQHLLKPQPTKKNLNIEGDDWKRVECLSWVDVIEYIWGDETLEYVIKQKFKKK